MAGQPWVLHHRRLRCAVICKSYTTMWFTAQHSSKRIFKYLYQYVVCFAMLAALAAGQQSNRTECDVMLNGGPGTLVHAVQLAQLFNDSKTFVDMPLKQNQTVEQLLQAFQQLPTNASTGSPNKADLQQLVNQYFDAPGSDLDAVTPPDLTQNGPQWISQLSQENNTLSNFTEQVYQLWSLLYRQESSNVTQDPSRHTLLPLPRPFVIAGDRFREPYYWDSYWVIRGLMATGMNQTARDIILNFLSQIDKVGHVPNGARCYYINRSQPPLLSEMVMAVSGLQPTGPGSSPNMNSNGSANVDKELLQQALPRLLAEWQYWNSGPKALLVSANGTSACSSMSCELSLSRYWADWYAPRPESYREDWNLAATKFNLNGTDLQNSNDARQLWHNLASAAESGWDFSSRWLSDPYDLSTIRTTQVIPADLNAFLAQMAQNIATIASYLGNTTVQSNFTALAIQRWESLNLLMWNTCTGSWHDLLITQELPANASTSSNTNTTTSGNNSASTPAGMDNSTTTNTNTGAADTNSTTGANSTNGSNSSSSGGSGNSSKAIGPVRVVAVQQTTPALASRWVPLWAGAVAPGSQQAAQAVAGLQSSGLLQIGGVLTSLVQTGQQWDSPNAWPPLQHMTIEGLAHAGVPGSDTLAKTLAARWLGSAEAAYFHDQVMHEKYNAFTPGVYGSGGEYRPQVGFGWTNGATLDLLHQGYRPIQPQAQA